MRKCDGAAFVPAEQIKSMHKNGAYVRGRGRTDYDGVVEQADDGYEIGDEINGRQSVAAAQAVLTCVGLRKSNSVQI